MRHEAEASPYPDGSRVVHIGLPKTGTSTIQWALHTHRDELEQHGVVYAGRRRHSYAAARAAMAPRGSGREAGGRREWEQIAAQVRDSRARCVIFSSEALSAAPAQRVRPVIEQLGGDVEVLVTLRALAPLAASNWQQRLRNQSTLSFPGFLEEVLADTPTTPAARVFRHRFGFDRYLDEWGAAVGEERLTFVVPDPADRGSLLGNLERLLGMPASSLVSTPPANQSLPFPEAELLRQFAGVFEAEGIPEDVWARTIGSWRTKYRLQKLRVPLESHPIRVPRWAAERSNELTLPWLAALRASDARVVGRPEDLLVEPGDHPEDVPTPDRMRIDAAAEIALVLFQAALRDRSEGGQRRSRRTTAPDRAAATAPDDPRRLEGVPARELARTLRRRAVRRLRRRGR